MTMQQPPDKPTHAAAEIKLDGRFDYSRHRDFKQRCGEALDNGQVSTIIVDLHQVAYMDSTALGMLLLLRDKASSACKRVELRGARGKVAEALKTANFHTLFAHCDFA